MAPNKKHPYGYGRIEYFTSIIIAVIILFAGITAARESINKILAHEKTYYEIVSLVVIAVAIIVKFFLAKYVKKVGKKVNSESLIGTGEEAFIDSIVSFSTLVAAIIISSCNNQIHMEYKFRGIFRSNYKCNNN